MRLKKISCSARVLFVSVLLPMLQISSCVEVYIAMGPSDCDGWVPPNEADEPVYICSNDKEESKRIILHCCTSSLPCIGWTGEWWYRDASDPNSSFKKYPQAGGQTAWVYVNNTNYPIRYLCNISSSYICEKGSGYIDIQRGLSPRISVVNHTDTFEVTTDTTKVSLYFEVVAYSPLTSEPRLTVNNSDLSSKWKIIYRSLNMNRIIHYTNWSHFLIEITTEDFKQEDSGIYTLTVSNTCSSSNKTVTIKVTCEDAVAFLRGGAESHHQCHTIEGRNVSFTYRCTGIGINNWWGVDGYEISTYSLLKFDESNSSYGCVNTLTLTLYDVMLYYSNVYTAYPSTSTKFSTTGINLTVHLRVHRYPRLYETLIPQVYNGKAQLGCTFIASNYDYPHFIQPVWRKGLNTIMSTSRFVQPQPSWNNEELVTIRLIINSVTPVDSGEYFCFINYSTDIIKEGVSSDHGKISLDLGSSSKSKKVPIIVGSVAGGLVAVTLLFIAVIFIFIKGIPYCRKKPRRNENTRLIDRNGAAGSNGNISTGSHQSDGSNDYDQISDTQQEAEGCIHGYCLIQ